MPPSSQSNQGKKVIALSEVRKGDGIGKRLQHIFSFHKLLSCAITAVGKVQQTGICACLNTCTHILFGSFVSNSWSSSNFISAVLFSTNNRSSGWSNSSLLSVQVLPSYFKNSEGEIPKIASFPLKKTPKNYLISDSLFNLFVMSICLCLGTFLITVSAQNSQKYTVCNCLI